MLPKQKNACALTGVKRIVRSVLQPNGEAKASAKNKADTKSAEGIKPSFFFEPYDFGFVLRGSYPPIFGIRSGCKQALFVTFIKGLVNSLLSFLLHNLNQLQKLQACVTLR